MPRAGFEPATYPLGGDRAIQLCHRGGVMHEDLQCIAINNQIQRKHNPIVFMILKHKMNINSIVAIELYE